MNAALSPIVGSFWPHHSAAFDRLTDLSRPFKRPNNRFIEIKGKGEQVNLKKTGKGACAKKKSKNAVRVTLPRIAKPADLKLKCLVTLLSPV